MKRKINAIQSVLLFMLITPLLCLMPAAVCAQTLVTSGLVRQYEAGSGVYQDTAKTTAATISGQAVANWADQSSTAADATQSSAGNQPTYQTSQFGSQPGILFTHGSNNGLNSAFLSGSAYTVVSVQKILSTNTNANNFPLYSNVGPGFGSGFDFAANNGVYDFAHSGVAEGQGGHVTSAITVTTISGSTSQVQLLRVNGVSTSLNNGGAYHPATGGNFSISVDPNGPSLACNETVGAILVYSRVLTTAEESQDEQYLANKYGGTVAGGPFSLGTVALTSVSGATTEVVNVTGASAGGTAPYTYTVERALAPGGAAGSYVPITSGLPPFYVNDAVASNTEYSYEIVVTDSSPSPQVVTTAPYLTTTAYALPSLSNYILCCFRNYNDNFKSEDERLLTLTGLDSVNFTPLNDDTYSPPYSDTGGGSVRDPQITRTADGTYYAVYTEGSYNPTATFAVAKSTNLVDWKLISQVNVGADSGFGSSAVVWRPTWFIDNDGSYHVLVFTGNDSTPSFRLFRYDPVATTGSTAFTSWSAGAETIINQSTGSRYTATIDPCLIHPAGGLYTLLYKDESTKYVCRATSSTLAGPFVIDRSGNWTGWGTGHEGPSPFKTATGWRVYSDAYGPPSTGLFYSDSTDLNTWTALQPVVVPSSWGTTRNGSVIQIGGFPAATIPKRRIQ